ncbi:MAG: SurA N-terminal domain-containing protein [Acidobacteria bacterium]|nr:SurA N-terminal domain-containing protein [Acidobacteriota bacterium]
MWDVKPNGYRSLQAHRPAGRDGRDFRISVLILLMLAFAPGWVACKPDPQNPPDGDLAARVNEAAIRISEVDRILEQQLRNRAQQGTATPLSAAELAAARLQIVDQLIAQEALYQRAGRATLLPSDDEVSQEIQRLKSSQQWSEEGFQRKLRDGGQTEPEFRAEMRRQVAIQKLFNKEVIPLVTVTDREIEEFYDANRAQFVEQRGFFLSQIRVDAAKSNASDDAVGPEAAAGKASEVYDQLRKGADFATVAAGRSEDPLSGPRGGALGFIAANASGLPPMLLQRLESMREGAFTEPIQSGDTWFIFKLDRRVERDRELKLDEVRSDIDKKVRADREQVLQEALTKTALGEARVRHLLAERMLANPSNFGSLRPISISADASPPEPK